jgi:hypothetical protein
MPMIATATLRPGASDHASVEDRLAHGRSVRQRVPRSSLAAWEVLADRPDPVDALERQAATREPSLVPLRYGRMLTSSFANRGRTATTRR